MYLKQGKIDCDWARVPGLYKDSSDIYMISETVGALEINVFSKKDIKIKGWASLKPYSTIYRRGTKILEKNLTGNSTKLNPVKKASHAFLMLDKNRADAFVDFQLVGLPTCQAMNCTKKMGIKMLQPPISAIPLFPYLRVEHKEKYGTLLHNAIKKLRDSGRMTEIAEGK